MHQQALLDMILSHMLVTEALLEDHIRLSKATTGDFDPKLSNMLSATRSLTQRVRELVDQSKIA